MYDCSTLAELVDLYWRNLISMTIPSDAAWWYYFNCQVLT